MNDRGRQPGGKTWGDRFSDSVAGLVAVGVITGGLWLTMGAPDITQFFRATDHASANPSVPAHSTVEQEPTQQEIDQAQRESWAEVTGENWSCFYDPTMNENWHDDVRCTDGVSSHRPELLADVDYVTEADMRVAGQEYEDYLNAGGMAR